MPHHKTADTPYNIHVTGRHVHVTEAMKESAIDKVSKLEKFINKIIDIHVTMDIQKLEHRVAIVMKFNHFKIKVQAASEDMYVSIDKAVVKLQSRIKKYKEKIQEHNAKATHIIDMNVNVYSRSDKNPLDELNDSIEEENLRLIEDTLQPHEIVKKENRPLKTLTFKEAMMKMDLSQDAFLVFKSEEDQKLKIIYRRDDQNYGVIEPE
jgi:putative sigma-54 modulation protein